MKLYHRTGSVKGFLRILDLKETFYTVWGLMYIVNLARLEGRDLLIPEDVIEHTRLRHKSNYLRLYISLRFISPSE